MQMDPTVVPKYTRPFLETRKAVLVAVNFNMNISSTSRESERTLKRRTNRPVVNPLSLSFFPNTLISLRELLEVMNNLHHVLGSLGWASRCQTCVDKLLQTISGFGCRMQERPTNSRQRAVISSDNRYQQANLRRLRDELDSSQAAHHQLRHWPRVVRDTFAPRGREFSVLAVDYFLLNNGRRHRSFETNYEQKRKRSVSLTFL